MEYNLCLTSLLAVVGNTVRSNLYDILLNEDVNSFPLDFDAVSDLICI